MTEDMAFDLWCPFSGKGRGKKDSTCCGSNCAAWRWDAPMYEEMLLRPPIEPVGEGWELASDQDPTTVNRRWQRLDPFRDGHCGLAGKVTENDDF